MSQNSTLIKLEESVYEVKAKSTVLEGKTTSLQSNVQELTTKVETTDKKVVNLATNAQKALMAIVDQNSTLEQSVISLGKLLTAFTKVLVKHDLIKDEEIMEELRLIEEANEKEKLEAMKLSGLLVEALETNEESLVILKQDVTRNGTTVTVSNFRPVQVSEIPKEDEVRGKILGLKIGDSFSNEITTKDDIVEKSTFTVLLVYDFKNSSELK